MPPETDDIEGSGLPTQQQVEPEEPPKKPKRKHTVETAEAIPFILLAILFDIISLATFMAPLIAVVGKLIFTAIWLMHGVMPWSKKYWSWYLISFVCEFIPFVSILPMFTIGELKMIAQSRVEDKLQETTGLAQAAIQIAKFKVRQNVKRQIAAGGLSPEELKQKQGLSKSLRFASARTLRRTMVNKAQGRGPKYRDPNEEGGEEGDTESADIQGARAPLSRPSRGSSGGTGSEAFDGVVAGASMAANAGRSASLPPTRPLPPKDADEDETAAETANAVAANANGVQGAPEDPEPVTTTSTEETEVAETISSKPPSATDDLDDTSPPDTADAPPVNAQAENESALDAPVVANDADEIADGSLLAQNGAPDDVIVNPQNVATVADPASPPVTDIYREPLPTNDNTAFGGTDTTTDEEDDEDQYPPVRRAA